MDLRARASFPTYTLFCIIPIIGPVFLLRPITAGMDNLGDASPANPACTVASSRWITTVLASREVTFKIKNKRPDSTVANFRFVPEARWSLLESARCRPERNKDLQWLMKRFIENSRMYGRAKPAIVSHKSRNLWNECEQTDCSLQDSGRGGRSPAGFNRIRAIRGGPTCQMS